MIKWLGIVLLLLCCYMVQAGVSYKIFQRYNNSGYSIIWIENYTPNTLYCWIDDGHYNDFSINPYSNSDEYFEPQIYKWGCE